MLLIKKKNAENYFLTVNISAISTILLIRLYLYINNYPQIGNGVWHVAHVLWGGIFLFLSLFLLLFYKGKAINITASIIGGIGWGFFIDEIGKFLTKNNDYFFQPAISIMYIIIILTFGIIFVYKKKRKRSQVNKLFTVLDNLEDIIRNDLTDIEKQEMIDDLKSIMKKPNNKNIGDISASIYRYIKDYKANDKGKQDFYLIKKINNKIINYLFNIPLNFFSRILRGVFLIKGLIGLILIMIWSFLLLSNHSMPAIYTIIDKYSISSLFELNLFFIINIFNGIISMLFLYSFLFFRKNTYKILLLIKYSLLASILIIDIFNYYFDQFSATIYTLLDLLLLFLINIFIQVYLQHIRKTKPKKD